jgi:hypothetical protein
LPPVVPDTPQPEPIIEYSTPAPTETEHSLQAELVPVSMRPPCVTCTPCAPKDCQPWDENVLTQILHRGVRLANSSVDGLLPHGSCIRV